MIILSCFRYATNHHDANHYNQTRKLRHTRYLVSYFYTSKYQKDRAKYIKKYNRFITATFKIIYILLSDV